MESYISSDIVKSMNYKSKIEVNLKQSLFDGIETVESVYKNYVIELSNVDGGYRCEFEVLGQERICSEIEQLPSDPAQRKSKIELEEETNKYFNETISVNSEGRYEVALPWIVDNSFLPENKMLAEKSLLSTKRKLASTARVEKLIPGRDGQTRLAVVKIANSEFLRPVQRLFRLEMDSPVLSVADDSTSVVTRSGRLVKPPVRL
ncbi:integrase catalytic domain-containing protein [Trichonephila clavata]|uniref:Integrase catalytic domain-containing protein n=1 Tax=Trichonephila clavata TaxID=2740835 RepID=A0A8X6GZ81_TRICU|nr:integrase catalytic domain-containing protein [Trichonephila clavata]